MFFKRKKIENWIIVKDWIESNKYDDIIGFQYYLNNLKYSSNGKSFTFGAGKDWKRILVKDWVEINKYDDILSFEYWPDGKSFILWVKKDWKQIIVKDWIEG